MPPRKKAGAKSTPKKPAKADADVAADDEDVADVVMANEEVCEKVDEGEKEVCEQNETENVSETPENVSETPENVNETPENEADRNDEAENEADRNDEADNDEVSGIAKDEEIVEDTKKDAEDKDAAMEGANNGDADPEDIEACMDEAAEGAPDCAETKKPEPEKEDKVEYEEDELEEVMNITPISCDIGMNVYDSTLNCTVSEGTILHALPGDGFQNLLAGARANVGVNKGRYYFECQLINVVKQGIDEIRFGVSTLAAHACLSDDNSVCFDSTGAFLTGKKRTHTSTKSLRLQRHDVMGILLNLEDGHHNVNTISLFLNGKRHSKPIPLPEELIGHHVYPHVTFKNVIVAINFTAPWKPPPFIVRMIGKAAVEDAADSPFVKVVDPEIVIPVGFNTDNWIKTFKPANSTFHEVSKQYITSWLQKSDVPTSVGGRVTGIPLLEDNGRAVAKLMSLRPRNYIYAFTSALTLKDREDLLLRLPGKKKCYVTISDEETPEVTSRYQDVALPTTEEGFDSVEFAMPEEQTRAKIEEWKKKCKLHTVVDDLKIGEWFRNKVKEWRDLKDTSQSDARDLKAKREVAEREAEKKKREKAQEEAKDGEEEKKMKDGEEHEKDETAEKQDEKDEAPAEATDEAKAEATDEKEAKATDETEAKATEEATDEAKADEAKGEDAMDEAKAEATDEKEENKQEKKEEKKVDTSEFAPEDWMLAQLRVELHLLLHGFKEDANDEDRQQFPSPLLATYYKMYNYRNLQMSSFECKTAAELCALVPDTAKEDEDGLLLGVREKDTSLVELLEETDRIRQDRVDRIRAGDEGSALKFKAHRQPSHFDRRPERSWRDDAPRRREDDGRDTRDARPRHDRREPARRMPSRERSRDRRTSDRRDEPIRRPRVPSKGREDRDPRRFDERAGRTQARTPTANDPMADYYNSQCAGKSSRGDDARRRGTTQDGADRRVATSGARDSGKGDRRDDRDCSKGGYDREERRETRHQWGDSNRDNGKTFGSQSYGNKYSGNDWYGNESRGYGGNGNSKGYSGGKGYGTKRDEPSSGYSDNYNKRPRY